MSKKWERLTRRGEWEEVDEVMVRVGHRWCERGIGECTGTRLMHHKARTKMENSVITNWDLKNNTNITFKKTFRVHKPYKQPQK